MKQNVMVLCLALVCTFTLSSCFPIHRFLVFNNTGDSVEIQSQYNATQTIEDGHYATFDDPFNLQISFPAKGKAWTYCITSYPSCKKYCQTSGLSTHKIRVQLEATGEIYVLLPSEKFSLTDFNNQPSGFPLEPIIQPVVERLIIDPQPKVPFSKNTKATD